MKYLKFLIFLLLLILGCTKNNDGTEPNPDETVYFPSNTDTSWETKSLSSLGWNESAIQPLKDYLIQKHTKSFMILVNGRIVMEEYFKIDMKDLLQLNNNMICD